MANPISNLGTIPTLTVGGRVFSDLTNLIMLFGCTDGATNIRSDTRKFGAQTGAVYQVTTGKTLAITASRTLQGGTASTDFGFAQIDNSNVGFNSSTAFTNPVFFGSESSTFKRLGVATASAGNVYENGGFSGKVVATKYIGIQQSAVGSSDLTHHLFGYEV